MEQHAVYRAIAYYKYNLICTIYNQQTVETYLVVERAMADSAVVAAWGALEGEVVETGTSRPLSQGRHDRLLP